MLGLASDLLRRHQHWLWHLYLDRNSVQPPTQLHSWTACWHQQGPDLEASDSGLRVAAQTTDCISMLSA